MMKKITLALALLLTVASAQATVVGGGLSKPKTTNSMMNFLKPKSNVVNPPAQTPPPATPQSTPTPTPQQAVMFFLPDSKPSSNDVERCEEGSKPGDDNVSAVPVPAALPLMATALGIFGITRRRKTFN